MSAHMYNWLRYTLGPRIHVTSATPLKVGRSPFQRVRINPKGTFGQCVGEYRFDSDFGHAVRCPDLRVAYARTHGGKGLPVVHRATLQVLAPDWTRIGAGDDAKISHARVESGRYDHRAPTNRKRARCKAARRDRKRAARGWIRPEPGERLKEFG